MKENEKATAEIKKMVYQMRSKMFVLLHCLFSKSYRAQLWLINILMFKEVLLLKIIRIRFMFYKDVCFNHQHIMTVEEKKTAVL